MTRCEETRSRLTLYLDDELEAGECAAIEGHLTNCVACRAMVRAERHFLELIREAPSRRAASPELRARVQELLLKNSAAVAPVPPELRKSIKRLLRHRPANAAQDRSSWFPRWALVAMALGALALLAGVWRWQNRVPAVLLPYTSDFAEMAADTHQRHLRGQLPLEIVSDVPGQLSAWFAGKVPFLIKLPNYQESSGQEKLYRLEGARLVSYKDEYAAYVAYQMRSRPISLVVTSDAVAKASGGEQIVAKEITFHYNSIHGLKVITWSDRGLTYALVSNLEERGQESCIVCHQGTKDRDFIESLKPR
jgi:anti-sigma factor RsiW